MKRHNPRIPLQLITARPLSRQQRRHFDHIDFTDENIHPLKAKVACLGRTRFRRTLFLDADTEVTSDISEIFSLPESVRFAVTFDNSCDWTVTPPRFLAQESTDVNTGFIYYVLDERLTHYLTEWGKLLAMQDETDMRPGHNCDQQYFNRYIRDRLFNDAGIGARILPNTVYNVRPWCWPSLKREGIFLQAKILHAHHLHHGLVTKLTRKFGFRSRS